MSEATLHYCLFDTALGACGIAWSARGVARFQLPAKDSGTTERLLLRRAPGAIPAEPPPAITEAIAGVKRYCAGDAVDFSAVSVDLEGQDTFFQQIYAALRRVPWGHTTTYGALAKELGAGPEAARDVGRAMAQNPVALIIPCHRVLAAGGKVGGFSAPGGSTAKVRMLALEGVDLAPPPPAQASFGF